MRVCIIQTTDAFNYFELFSVTSAVNRAYCKRYGFEYIGYVGLRVGTCSWHATYNRIPLLADLMNDGYRGWVIYLDADAYIASLDFDFERFLHGRSGAGLIAAPGGGEKWCINAGILIFDFSNDFARRIVAEWNCAFSAKVGREKLAAATIPWQEGIKDDQVLLHEILRHEDLTQTLSIASLAEVGAPVSTCIRQILRQNGALEERVRLARKDCDEIMSLC